MQSNTEDRALEACHCLFGVASGFSLIGEVKNDVGYIRNRAGIGTKKIVGFFQQLFFMQESKGLLKGAEAGEEVANDYFLSNENPSLRSITITGEVPVFEIEATQPDVFLTVPFADWPIDPNLYVACPDPFCGVWLYVNDGTVTEMVEQYFP